MIKIRMSVVLGTDFDDRHTLRWDVPACAASRSFARLRTTLRRNVHVIMLEDDWQNGLLLAVGRDTTCEIRLFGS